MGKTWTCDWCGKTGTTGNEGGIPKGWKSHFPLFGFEKIFCSERCKKEWKESKGK